MNTCAFEEGYKAYENYQHLSECPHFENEKLFNEWCDGYLEAREDYVNGDVLGKWA